MSYPILSVETFARRLIETRDLDPLYNALNEMKWSDRKIREWLLAYWMFYHPGLCGSIVADSRGFWPAVEAALPSGPRGTERRHFRGTAAETAVLQLQQSFAHPDVLVSELLGGGRRCSFAEVKSRVLQLPQFGDWIAFKIADMGETVLGFPIDFSDCYLGIYRDPLKGAALIFYGDQNVPLKREEVTAIYDEIVEWLRVYPSPAKWTRPCGIQEAETVACKYKSHVNGHYPLGKDIRDIREGLEMFDNQYNADLLKVFNRYEDELNAYLEQHPD